MINQIDFVLINQRLENAMKYVKTYSNSLINALCYVLLRMSNRKNYQKFNKPKGSY